MVFYILYLLGLPSPRYFPCTPQQPTRFVRGSCKVLYLLNIPLSTCHPQGILPRLPQERGSSDIFCLSFSRQWDNDVTGVLKSYYDYNYLFLWKKVNARRAGYQDDLVVILCLDFKFVVLPWSHFLVYYTYSTVRSYEDLRSPLGSSHTFK